DTCSERVIVEALFINTYFFAIPRPPLGEVITELLIRPSRLQLWKHAILRSRCGLLDVFHKAEAQQLRMEGNATFRLLVLNALGAFIVDVQKPNAILLLHISAVQLRELLKAVAVIDAEQRQPVLLVLDDEFPGFRATSLREAARPYRR